MVSFCLVLFCCLSRCGLGVPQFGIDASRHALAWNRDGRFRLGRIVVIAHSYTLLDVSMYHYVFVNMYHIAFMSFVAHALVGASETRLFN